MKKDTAKLTAFDLLSVPELVQEFRWKKLGVEAIREKFSLGDCPRAVILEAKNMALAEGEYVFNEKKEKKATLSFDEKKVAREELERARKLQIQHENKELRKQAGLRQSLIDALQGELRSQPVIEVRAPQKSRETALERKAGRKPRTLILQLSDLHVGQLFKRSENGGLGGYDFEVFNERAHRLTDKVLAIHSDLQQSGPVEKMVLMFNGDMIDGRTIHPGHDHESEGMAKQLRIGPEVLAQALIRPLAERFPQIDVFANPGNHGRLGKKGELHRVEDSLDLVFMDILKLRCEHIPHICWHEWNNWYSWFRLHGHTYFAAHGDAFASWLGIPFYGGQRYKQRIESLINAPIDVLMCGHHHSPAHWTQGFGNVVMNGSWVGASSFGSWLGMGGAPVQKMILCDDSFAAATTYDLILETREKCLTAQPVVL